MTYVSGLAHAREAHGFEASEIYASAIRVSRATVHNADVCRSGAGVDRVYADRERVAARIRARVTSSCAQLGQKGGLVAVSRTLAALFLDRYLVPALHGSDVVRCLPVETDEEVVGGVRVDLDYDGGLTGRTGSVADLTLDVAGPVFVQIDLMCRVAEPTRLPTLCVVEAHNWAVVIAVRVPHLWKMVEEIHGRSDC